MPANQINLLSTVEKLSSPTMTVCHSTCCFLLVYCVLSACTALSLVRCSYWHPSLLPLQNFVDTNYLITSACGPLVLSANCSTLKKVCCSSWHHNLHLLWSVAVISRTIREGHTKMSRDRGTDAGTVL